MLGKAPGDGGLQRFTGESAEWATVAPVILPGHEDRGGLRKKIARVRADPPGERALLEKLNARIEALLRKALVQSGLAKDLVERAELDWRGVAFVAGVPNAAAFEVPAHLRSARRLHVRITFRDERGDLLGVRGPLCVGSGRFYGLGLLAALPG